MSIALNLLLVLVFVLIGGVFAATEMALVSLRESQIKRLERGSGAAQTVAGLARDSGLFLSAVQIGVTFAGFFSSAFGASTVAPQIAPVLIGWGLNEAWANGVALVGMTLVVSYLSLVLGELVPKRIAMQKAEGVALIVAPPLKVFAQLMRPVIWVINTSSNGLLRLLGFDPDARTEEMSTEEVRDIVSSHDGLAAAEREMLDDVFEAGEKLVGEVMRHRSDMVAFDANLSVGDATQEISGQPYSRYPVFRESIDEVLGFVHVRDVLEHAARGENDVVLSQIARPIAQFPSSLRVPQALGQMKADGHHIAIVVDEYGGTDGMVTLEDLLEELVGEIWDEYDKDEKKAVMALHESRLIDGATSLEDFRDSTGISLEDGPYETVAGWMLAKLGRLAVTGDVAGIDATLTKDTDDDTPGIHYQLEVVEISGNRIVALKLLKTISN
ncbi:hemolysin family protein [Corynebacterium breve]|uniref:Hemolysin family protein n=1 Tax=Corynebacterium breve TaxID=3049799 RepID=A0ABY8VHV2_9CORY|nr:hemolysin family protein [Corynebacterium breve]WIM68541.1 hemolysin family protein [Corynebacterium breve]